MELLKKNKIIYNKFLYLACLLLFIQSCSGTQSKRNSIDEPLNFDVQGAGQPAVIMLHGILGSHHYWDGVVTQLGKHHKLILIDLLGFGESPKPDIKYSVIQHLRKIEDVIEKIQPEKDKAVIVGHSMGAFLALNYAIAFPNRVKKIILINAPMNTDEESLKKAIAESSSKLMVTMTFSKTWGKFVCEVHELMPLISYPLIRIFESELPPAVAKAAGQHTFLF